MAGPAPSQPAGEPGLAVRRMAAFVLAVVLGTCGAAAAGAPGAQHAEADPAAVAAAARRDTRPHGTTSTLALATLAALACFAAGFGYGVRRRHPPVMVEPAPNSVHHLEAVLLAMREGLILTDLNRRIELINPVAEVLFGVLREDATGSDAADLLPSLFDERLDAQLLADQDGPGVPLPILRETLAQRSDGEAVPLRIWVHRLPFGGATRLLLLIEDLTESAAQEEQLSYLRQHDVLTGLLNRAELERRMQTRLSFAAKARTPCAVCSLDIDRFHLINDSAGHEAGDAVVTQLAMLVRSKLARASLIGRLGGDEIAALFIDCTEAEVIAQCNELLRTVQSFLFTWRERSFDLSISIGVIAFIPEDDTAATEIARADIACHMARRAGGARLHVYRDSDMAVIEHIRDLQVFSSMPQILDEKRLRLHVQPIQPLLISGPLMHYEVLVRINNEHGDLIEPERFIPAAERYILMPAVDRWIIQRLFSTEAERLRRWHRRHPDQFLFAVNLSGTSIDEDGFLAFVERQFAEHDIPHPSICFEITETAAIRHLPEARGPIRALAARGCRFALDDFGSGLASFGYLRDLPVQLVKIDGSFVHDIGTNPINHALVQAINQVAHILGLETIAEWAEDEQILGRLRALGVDYAQGWAVGRPMPIERLGDTLRKPSPIGSTQPPRA